MTPAQVFREAAKSLHKGFYCGCCEAIRIIGWPFSDYIAQKFFKEYFQPKGQIKYSYWWNKKDRKVRIIALLLAAEIWEDENDH